jgi:hypothetical protein
MQKFFTDKSKLFECNISVDGAKLNETKARLILEFPNNRNLLFYGNIDNYGKCQINIPALKEMNECEGIAKLEVIAESTYFETWNDNFKLETDKKVRVEMIEPKKETIIESTTPKISVNIKTEEVEILSEQYKLFNTFLATNKIDLNESLKNKTKFFDLLHTFKKENNLSKEDIMIVAEEIKKNALNSKIDTILKS